MLSTRLWTALIALPLVLAAILFGSDRFFVVFIAILGAWALYEVAAMTRADSFAAIALLIVGGGAPFALLIASERPPSALPAALMSLLMSALVIRVATSGPTFGRGSRVLTLIGAAYVGVFFPYFALLRNRADGIALVILMLLLVMACDSGAYFIGSRIGRTRLAPLVSPKKSVEGVIGGLAASIAAGFILWNRLAPDWTPTEVFVVSVVVAILAIIGDLAGSALKRCVGVKDSGWIFPGHGGLIDRTCSLCFAAVFTYYWAK